MVFSSKTQYDWFAEKTKGRAAVSQRFDMPSTAPVDLTGRAVLQVVPELDVGGAEITTLEITRAIVAAGGRALVASQGGALEDALRDAGGEILYLPVASKNPLTVWRNAALLAALAEAERVDLIHTRSRAPGWSGLRAGRLAGLPFMTTYHSTVHDKPRAKVLYNSVLVRGARCIANSHYTAGRIAAVYPQAADRLRVIPRGCDVAALARSNFTDAERAAKRAQWGIPQDAFIIMCPARVTHLKGQHLLVEALADLVADLVADLAVQGPTDVSPHLVLVGSAQGRDDYVADLKARAAARKIADRLHFAGLESDMPSAYAAAHLAVVPTIRPEPFGRTIIEAQAASLPVIASDAGGFRETVIAAAADKGGTGWLVTPDSVAALTAAFKEALALPQETLFQLGENGRANAEANYTQTAMCNRTLNVYAELMA